MKIRIKGDSIRIRLSKTEVDTFGKEGFLEESTHIAQTVFKYGIVSRHDISSMQASFEGGAIHLLIPQHWSEEWVATQRISYDSRVSLDNGGELYLLLEKDFQCLDNTTEDQSDMYPNPLAEEHK